MPSSAPVDVDASLHGSSTPRATVLTHVPGASLHGEMEMSGGYSCSWPAGINPSEPYTLATDGGVYAVLVDANASPLTPPREDVILVFSIFELQG